MNQGGYYGAYQGGFQTLPKGAYEMMTAPNRMNAETIQKAASGIGNMVQKYADQKAGSEASQQGAAAQFKGLETVSQATGVPMNPVLSEQYMNMGGMSPQQQAVFQNSLGQEAQRMQMLYGINQAQARAGQAQGMQQQKKSVYAGLGTVPAADPSRYGGQPVMPMGLNQIDPSLLPSYPSLFVSGYGDRVGPLRPMNQR